MVDRQLRQPIYEIMIVDVCQLIIFRPGIVLESSFKCSDWPISIKMHKYLIVTENVSCLLCEQSREHRRCYLFKHETFRRAFSHVLG